MKFTVATILSVLLAFAACLFLPWWTVAITSAIVAFTIIQKPGYAFLSGFIGLFLLWFFLNLSISNANGHILANKASMLILKMKNIYLMFFISALIGAIIGGMGALCGCYARKQNISK